MSTEIKSEYQAVTVKEIKDLILFDIENFKFNTGQDVIKDEFIAAQITLAEQEVYSYVLRNNKKPADYTPDHFKVVIKKLVINRIKEV